MRQKVWQKTFFGSVLWFVASACQPTSDLVDAAPHDVVIADVIGRSDAHVSGGDAATLDVRSADVLALDVAWRDAGAADRARALDAWRRDRPALDQGAVDLGQGADAGTAELDAGAGGADFCLPLDSPRQLIADRRFRRGFVALDPSGNPAAAMPTGLCAQEPIWHLAQWGSLGDLSQVSLITLPSGAKRWSNDYGRLTEGLLGAAEADLAFGIWAFAEYGGQYRSSSDSRVWVHLLAEQRISPPGTTRAGCPPLSSLASLDFSMVARLLQDDSHRQSGYDPGQHAAQFLVYFTVQNLNAANPGFGDYLWFGLTPYDDRHPVSPLSVSGDQATGKLIYNIGAAPFVSVGLSPGGPEQRFAKDLLPDIRLALLEAWSRGYLVDSRRLSDYRIGGMNIGWEVPGLNDVELRVRDLSLTYETRVAQPLVFDFNVDGDRQGWTSANLIDSDGGPQGGLWVMVAPGDDPALTSPVIGVEAAAYSRLRVVMANDGNPAESSTLQVYWQRFGAPSFAELRSVRRVISNGGGWQTVEFDMSQSPEWLGEITRLRVDPVIAGDGHAVGIDQIALLP